MRFVAIIFSLLLMCNETSLAADRVSRCQIESNHAIYKGMCVFSPGEMGSFTLSNPIEGKLLLEGISSVIVIITDKGVAEVRGLTLDGINSRWGEAKRSLREKACWVGEDFKICAW